MLSDTPNGLKIETALSNLPMGFHGTHVHEYGDLSPSQKGDKRIAGGMAGSHYDPDKAGYHSSPTGNGHKGDLPRIYADDYGESYQTLYAPRLKLDEILGRSIVIHRFGDNYSDHPLPNGGGKERLAGGIIKKHCGYCSNPRKDINSKGFLVPESYLEGYTGALRKQRIKEIVQRNKEIEKARKRYGKEDNFPQALKRILYRPFPSDKMASTERESPYTQAARERGFNISPQNKDRLPAIAKKMGLTTTSKLNKTKIKKDGKLVFPKYILPLLNKTINASMYYGTPIPFNVVLESYRRGAGAWKTGHRGGQTPESWGYGRVNSFLVGGETFFTTDNDLARSLPEQVYIDIEKQRVWNKK